MQAILTTSKKLKTASYQITARTASGKTASAQFATSSFAVHAGVAKRLTDRMGWGDNLIAGETKEGFAFIPASATNNGCSWADVEKAAHQLTKAAAVFPAGANDPIRLASGIIDLAKASHAKN